jgi:hypothetical protein
MYTRRKISVRLGYVTERGEVKTKAINDKGQNNKGTGSSRITYCLLTISRLYSNGQRRWAIIGYKMQTWNNRKHERDYRTT